MTRYFSSIILFVFVVIGNIQPLSGAVQPDFTLAADPTAVRLPVRGTATSQITLSAVNGFDDSVQLECSNLPPGVYCQFTPAWVQVQGVTPVSSQLLISTTPPKLPVGTSRGRYAGVALIPMLGGLFFLYRGRALSKVVLLVLLAGIMLLTACQGLGTKPSNTYTIAVTGTASGGLSHSIPMQITLEQ